MKLFRCLGIACAGLLIAVAPVVAHEGHDDHGTPDGADPMAAMMEALKPTPHHLSMNGAAGKWTTSSTFWMEPGAEPMKSTGTSSIELIMNGLFISEVTNADMFGMPWEGRGVFGYDTHKKKHIGTWFDSFGTYMMNFAGDCDGACKVVSLYADYFDPMSGSQKRMKSMTTHVDADHMKVELFDVDGEGKETRLVVIDYARGK